MAVRTLPGARNEAFAAALPRLPTAVLAAVLPVVFLHIENQPSFHVWRAEIALSDIGVLLVGVLALGVVLRDGLAPLRAGRPVWIAAGTFLTLAFAACFYPLASDRAYDWQTHAVSVGKFAEYALLALAVPVLVRGLRDLRALLWVLALWCALATLVALVQFLGADVLDAWSAGRRQPSFLGHHDFAALAGGTACIALVALALPGIGISRRLALLAGIGGCVGLVLSGSSAGTIGFGAAALACALVARARTRASLRRLAAIVGIAAVTGAGVVALRGGDIEEFVQFLGLREKTEQSAGVETYVQRTLLAYIGLKIFADHPVLGVGWNGSNEESGYGPYLDDARREFPDAPPLAFPSPEHPYGVQNAYIQALADLGVVGLALWLAFFGAALFVAARALLRGPPAIAPLIGATFVLVAMGVWTAMGLVAGIPLAGLTWLGVGLAVTRE